MIFRRGVMVSDDVHTVDLRRSGLSRFLWLILGLLFVAIGLIGAPIKPMATNNSPKMSQRKRLNPERLRSTVWTSSLTMTPRLKIIYCKFPSGTHQILSNHYTSLLIGGTPFRNTMNTGKNTTFLVLLMMLSS